VAFTQDIDMSDPFQGPPGTNPPRRLRPDGDNGAIGWTLGAVCVVALLGVSYWAWSERAPAPTNPPAVTAAPAPAPDTTTGQAR
jgi:hypothetical protein